MMDGAMKGEAILTIGMLLIFALSVLIIITPESKNCKQTGGNRLTTSFIVVGPMLLPYMSQQPKYECSAR